MTSSRSTTSRAARLELMARLDLARHAADLLHSKELALQRERVRLEGHADRAREEWERCCEDAAVWLQRSRALGATDELDALVEQGPEPADVAIQWQVSMGITYPGSVDCTPGVQTGLASTSALRPAEQAHDRALVAAATHAASFAAATRLDTELANTRRRRRAIEERLLPRLESGLHELDLDLDEQDREEALRVQLAVGQRDRTPT